MARGRKPIEVSKEGLQQAISTLESQAQFPNRAALWAAVEATPFALSCLPQPLKAQVAMMKAQQFELEIKTPKGQRGRSKGCGPIAGGGRKKKILSETAIEAVVNGIPVTVQEAGRIRKVRESLTSTIAKFGKGSMKAAIKLKCLDCCCWQLKEIAVCSITECSLHSFRPYKRVEDTEDKKISLEVVA